MDEETYECVKSFCYLGDTLDGDGGVDLAATAVVVVCHDPRSVFKSVKVSVVEIAKRTN